MKYALAFLITATLLSSCSNSDNKSQVISMSFKELDQKCQIGQSVSDCDTIHNAPIRIEGILSFSKFSENQSVLHPKHIKTFDEENDDHWYSSIQIMGTIDERKSLRKFDKKHVVAEGLIDTSCVIKHTELNRFNEKSLQSENDEIIVRMATGHCHYVNNRAFFAPRITVKDDDK